MLAWNLKIWTRLPVLPASMMTAYLSPFAAPPLPEDLSSDGTMSSAPAPTKLSGPDRGMINTTASTSSSCTHGGAVRQEHGTFTCKEG